MINNNLQIALWLVCFFDAIILLCLPTAEKVIFSTDGSAARYIVDLTCMAIGLSVLFTNGWKKLPSKALGLLLIIMLVSHFHAPNIVFQSTFIPKDHAIFDYKPMFEAILFFMLFMGIYSLEIGLELKGLIRKSLVWISTIYACFAILQRFGLDQFYTLAGPVVHMSRNPEVGGFISQPVYCAALIAICIPFIFRYGRMWQVLISLGGILATGNRSAIVAMLLSAIFVSQYKKTFKFLFFAYLTYLAGGVLLNFIPSLHVNYPLEERFSIWCQVIKDFVNPSFPGINSSQILSGTGLGSFSIIFPFYHHNGWYQAHNEMLEALRCLGVVGFGTIIYFIWKLKNKDKILMSSLVASFILSMTNPIWHIPQLAFLTVFILALVYNNTGENYVAIN